MFSHPAELGLKADAQKTAITVRAAKWSFESQTLLPFVRWLCNIGNSRVRAFDNELLKLITENNDSIRR